MKRRFVIYRLLTAAAAYWPALCRRVPGYTKSIRLYDPVTLSYWVQPRPLARYHGNRLKNTSLNFPSYKTEVNMYLEKEHSEVHEQAFKMY